MKRNWDLIRLMLLGIDEDTLHEIRDYNAREIGGKKILTPNSRAEILIHFFLLQGAGFVENSRVRGMTLTLKGELRFLRYCAIQ